MAWCENENCNNYGRNVLRKADVEFCDDTRKVLCHGCYALRHPGWYPPVEEYVDMTDTVPRVVRTLPSEPRVGFAVQVTDTDGIRAKVSYGGASITLHAPPAELKRLVGG